MDNLTVEQRHYNMSRISNKGTKPEEKVRKYLFSLWFRYRKNDKRFPGHPDIVLPKYKTIIFANGCFWHMHDCNKFVLPKSNLDYWKLKLEKNKQTELVVNKINRKSDPVVYRHKKKISILYISGLFFMGLLA